MLAIAMLASPVSASAQPGPGPAAIVQGILSVPDDQLDFARAKLAFDRIAVIPAGEPQIRLLRPARTAEKDSARSWRRNRLIIS